jgi:GMP synthase-like glutamine amidotransferase
MSTSGGPAELRPVIVIEHQANAPAGLLGEWLGEREIAWENVRATTGPLPEPATAAAIVTLGSEHAAYAPAPQWIGDELRFLRAALAQGIPVLGICFGAQALALAARGRVARAARPEVGWVEPQSDVEQLRGPWLSWHYDAIDLPPEAIELARSDGTLQAFGLGPHLGLQFHPEVTPAIWQGWAQEGPEVVIRHAGDPAALAAEVSARLGELRARVFALLDWWRARLAV